MRYVVVTFIEDGEKTKRPPRSNEVEQTFIVSSLNFVALEEVILLALGAVRALQTANQEHGHTNSDKDGEDIRVSLEPVDQSSHKGSAFSAGSVCRQHSRAEDKPGLVI